MTLVLIAAILVASLAALLAALRSGALTGARATRVIGGAAVAAAALLLLARQPGLAVALGTAGATLLAQGRPRLPRFPRRSARAAASEIRTGWLAMRLDHATGALDGEVLAGPFAGRRLSTLSLPDLLALGRALARADPESLRLLEGFLDRAHPGWRDAAAQPAPPASGPMSREEAARILGVAPDAAAAEIDAAYKRLIKRVHPDLGGSPGLAAQLNAARAALLGD